MKGKLTGKKRAAETGSATLEILIAFALLILGMTAVIMVVFGNQTLSVDSQLNNEALYQATEKLEEARGTARENFYALNATSTESADGFYDQELSVTDITPCRKDVTSTVHWTPSPLRNQSVELATIFTSMAAFADLGGDCGVEEPDAWRNPQTLSTADLEPSGNVANDIDVLDGYAYLASTHPSAAKDDFSIFDVSDPLNPTLTGSLNTGEGLNSVDVAGTYAYVAAVATSSQLLVIDVSDKANPTIAGQASLDGVDPGGSYPSGYSIFYLNNRVYVGTKETAGHEFHIFDVSSPTAPTELGSLELTHNVNKIFVRDTYAYLATSDNSGELMIIDISNPGSLIHPDTSEMKFNAAGNEDGWSVYVLGPKAYLGKARSPINPDFYILNISTPTAITQLGSKILGNKANTRVTDMVVNGNLAFLATNDSNRGFQVWNIADPANIQSQSILNYSEKATGIDFVGNLIYLSNESNNALRILYDNP